MLFVSDVIIVKYLTQIVDRNTNVAAADDFHRETALLYYFNILCTYVRPAAAPVVTIIFLLGGGGIYKRYPHPLPTSQIVCVRTTTAATTIIYIYYKIIIHTRGVQCDVHTIFPIRFPLRVTQRIYVRCSIDLDSC